MGQQASTKEVATGKAIIKNQAQASSATQQMQGVKDNATEKGNTRAQQNRHAAAGAGRELGGLQHDITTRRAVTTSTPACQAAIDRARTAEELFGNCSSALKDLAGKADNHANDAQTLSDAWPVLPAASAPLPTATD